MSAPKIDGDTGQGSKINEEFFVDFGTEPAGPVRAHEMRYPRGDVTSVVWIWLRSTAHSKEKPQGPGGLWFRLVGGKERDAGENKLG